MRLFQHHQQLLGRLQMTVVIETIHKQEWLSDDIDDRLTLTVSKWRAMTCFTVGVTGRLIPDFS